jgi:hypothetical protein
MLSFGMRPLPPIFGNERAAKCASKRQARPRQAEARRLEASRRSITGEAVGDWEAGPEPQRELAPEKTEASLMLDFAACLPQLSVARQA